MDLTGRICDKARDLGFDLAGVTSAYPVPGLEAYQAWIERGFHAEMGYMARPDRAARRADPDLILPDVRSFVCVGLNYYPGEGPEALLCDPARGRISNYAWGVDYHALVSPRLEALSDFIVAEADRLGKGPATARAYVDTGPVLERAYAARAGLGFMGKNTSLIHPRRGATFFLGEILLDVALQPSGGTVDVDCGVCQRCLDACPTGALAAPRLLDARRCISYLTIEHKGPIPASLRPLMGNWIYGCDVCLSVCPWQRFSRMTAVDVFRADSVERVAPRLLDVMGLDEEGFRRRYAGTPIRRIGRARLLRNVAVALGNWGDEAAVGALAAALTDAEPLARGHAAWALGRIGGRIARRALRDALIEETDGYVRREIAAARTTAAEI
jgi:epoxyqueuosine reductase